jgi:hypothetical protein
MMINYLLKNIKMALRLINIIKNFINQAIKVTLIVTFQVIISIQVMQNIPNINNK